MSIKVSIDDTDAQAMSPADAQSIPSNAMPDSACVVKANGYSESVQEAYESTRLERIRSRMGCGCQVEHLAALDLRRRTWDGCRRTL